jgi:uncharacterized protein (TIGR00251 family)
MTGLSATATAGGVRIAVRVMPRSPRNGIDGVRDGRLVVRVTAPPVDDAANEAVVTLLASTLALPRHAVRIVAGAAARNKTVAIAGTTPADVLARLEATRNA